jgi:RNA polymerase primary sigma factor
MCLFKRKRLTLSKAEELDLSARARAGDIEARNMLVEQNMRLAYMVAHRYRNATLEFEDLKQESLMGLVRAAKDYDARIAAFSTYAVHWIRQSIGRAIENMAGSIRVPVYQSANLRKLKRATSEFTQTYERMPTDIELSEYTGIDLKTVRNVMNACTTPISIHEGWSDEQGNELAELELEDPTPSPEEQYVTDLYADEFLSYLRPREAEIVALYYGCEGDRLSLDQIGVLYGMSRERIRGIIRESIISLRFCAPKIMLED